MQVTWWGHSSVTAQWAGSGSCSTRCWAIRSRTFGAGAALRRLRARSRADAVVISHLHADHCHLPSLRLLGPDTLVIGPRGMADFLPRSRRGSSLHCQNSSPVKRC